MGDDKTIINTPGLDLQLRVVPFRLAFVTPNRNESISPRFDYQLNTNNTLVVRYSYSRFKAERIGASDFSLPSRAFNRSNRQQTVQITETAVLSPKMLNET